MIQPEDLFTRSIMLYGPDGFRKLRSSYVAVIGLGGVGSYAAEALVRAGIGKIRIIDCDVVKHSDINRQIIALVSTVGSTKVSAMKERLLAINPFLLADDRHDFFHIDTASELVTKGLDFVIDAIDGLNPKTELIRYCTEQGINIISCLGAGGKTDPSMVRVARLDETSVCPLARSLRQYLRRRGASTDIPVVYSTESPMRIHTDASSPPPEINETIMRGRARSPLPSLSTIPGIFGLFAANYVIMNLLGTGQRNGHEQ